MVATHSWSAVADFKGRERELEYLESWWREPPITSGINLFGRRRVGKSWLFRRFAHGKPAVILVVEEATEAERFSKLADDLEPHLGLRPEITNFDSLFRAIFQLGRGSQVLVVLDELPYLLGTTATDVRRSLSSIQAAIERYRDGSQTRLLICGSTVAQMEDLQRARNPLHGRFSPLELLPMTFAEARQMLAPTSLDDQFTRYAIAGGMPTYLAHLGRGGLEAAIASAVVARTSPLFDEPMRALTTELREPSTYLSILNAMAEKPADSPALHAATGVVVTSLPVYLSRLENLKLVRPRRPVGAKPTERNTQWECCDHFFRFWFRFVRRFQADLSAGADPSAHVRAHVMPNLADHTARVFEDEVRRWCRAQYPVAGNVGAWWGNSLNSERAAGTRSTEEIDLVGLDDRNVVLVGEAKWERRKTSRKVLGDLVDFKIPALGQAKLRVPAQPQLVICSRSGFSSALVTEAEAAGNVRLVEANEILGT